MIPHRQIKPLLPLLGLALMSCSEPTGLGDTRGAPKLVLEGVQDHGIVLRHGNGPHSIDVYGARDVWVYEADGTYFMHYDAAGPSGWLAALATSKDLITWEPQGAVLELGAPGADDSQSASYGVTFQDNGLWHMFYLGTAHASPPPSRVPRPPYLTLKAQATSPAGPWIKQPDVVPFRPKGRTYYAMTAGPGHTIKLGEEYLQFFSAAALEGGILKRTIGIARTRDLNGTWTVAPAPILPSSEQIENASLYYEPANGTWFLFTNHVGVDGDFEYTDAIWVYWTRDLSRWDRDNRAVVLDGSMSTWSKRIIGLPSVIPVGNRLAIFYDGVEGTELSKSDASHMQRNIGLAWVSLPLVPPR